VNVLIFGAGAIGSILGGRLAANGHSVRLLDDWLVHVAAINERGLLLEGGRRRLVSVPASAVEACDPATCDPDLIFISGNSQDTVRLAKCAKAFVRERTLVLSSQNGMNEDAVAEVLGSSQVVGAVTELGGYLVEPGHVRETREDGGLVIGELSGGVSRRVLNLAAELDPSIRARVSGNIQGLLWSKLVWNSIMNPLTAASDLGQGAVLLDPEIRELAVGLAVEAGGVARALGIRLEPLEFLGVDLAALTDPTDVEAFDAAWRHLAQRYESQLDKSTSMSQDIRSGRTTEIDALNGYLIARADHLGIEVPLNREIVAAVKRIENREERPSRQRLRAITGHVPS
jgi:2-dehydropantoate 2-reductase